MPPVSAGPIPSLATFRRLPKVDLHLHLEGAIPWTLLRRLAQQRGLPEPAALRFSTFDGFLKAFAAVCSYLRQPRDFRLAVVTLGKRLKADGVVHAEVFISPQVHARAGLSWRELAPALEDGAARVEAAGGPSLLFIADGVRQWGSQAFMSMLTELSRYPSRRLAGVGLGGQEGVVPDSDYRQAFTRARDMGLSAVIHAGETGPPEAVQFAVEELGAHRIGHGIAVAALPAARAALRKAGVPLDVCLTSNRRTGAVPRGRPHPLAMLVRQCLPVTLGSDDPVLFRTSLSAEYRRAAAMGLTWTQLAGVASTSAAASLLSKRRARTLQARLQKAWSEAPEKS